MARKQREVEVSAKGEVSPPKSLNEVDEQVEADADEGDADFDAVRAAGAVSAESVAFNAQTKDVITGKRDRSRRIRWNDDNAQVIYDSIRQAAWNTASTYIMARRVTGEPAQWSIGCAAIPSGLALHEWVLTKCHRQSPPHTYEIRVVDSHTGQERGRGKLFMPDTLDGAAPPTPPPAAPNPYAQYGQNPYGPPPGTWYPGQPPPASGAAPAAPQAAPPPPPPAQISAVSNENAELRAQVAFLSGQIAEMLKRAGMPAPPPPAPTVVVAPPSPQPPAPPPPAPVPATDKPAGAPPGLVHVPGFGYVNAELVASALMTQMRAAVVPPAQHSSPPPPQPRHDPPPPPPAGLGGLPVPQAEQASLGSMVQQSARNMREAASGLSSMLRAAEEIRDTFAPPVVEARAEVVPMTKAGDPAKKPFEVLDAGPVRVPYDPETGDMKGIANLLMVNADKIGGFVGKLYEKAAVAAAQAAAAQSGKTFTPPPSLPNGGLPGPLPNGTTAQNWPPPPPLPRP
jgi:hypothetical protein